MHFTPKPVLYFFYNKVQTRPISSKPDFPATSVARSDMWLSPPDINRKGVPCPSLSFKLIDMCSPMLFSPFLWPGTQWENSFSKLNEVIVMEIVNQWDRRKLGPWIITWSRVAHQARPSKLLHQREITICITEAILCLGLSDTTT